METMVNVRFQYVLVTGIDTSKKKERKEFPNKAGKQNQKLAYIEMGAFKIGNSDLEEINQEMRRRATLDYIEDVGIEESGNESKEESRNKSDW